MVFSTDVVTVRALVERMVELVVANYTDYTRYMLTFGETGNWRNGKLTFCFTSHAVSVGTLQGHTATAL